MRIFWYLGSREKLLGTKKLEVSSPRAHIVCVSQAPGVFERIDAIRRTFGGYDFDDKDTQFSQKMPWACSTALFYPIMILICSRGANL